MQTSASNYNWRDTDLEQYRLPSIDVEKSIPFQKKVDEAERTYIMLFRLQILVFLLTLVPSLWLLGDFISASYKQQSTLEQTNLVTFKSDVGASN